VASHEDVSRALLRAGAIKFGEFTYASGAKGPVYVDLRRLVSFPAELDTVCSHLADLVREQSVDVVLGAATAGIPFATLVSVKTGIPMCYIRKEAKGHGTKSLVEGVFERGQRAVLLDDLVTSGASKGVFVEGAREAGLVVDDLAVVLDRRPDDDGGAIARLSVTLRSLLTLRDLLAVARTEGAATDEDIRRVDAWLKGGA